jgi:hypothetical protein
VAQGALSAGLAAAGWGGARSLRIDDWDAWWASVSRPVVLGELLTLVLGGLLAWGLAAGGSAWARGGGPGIWLGRRGLDGALFPLWLGLTWLARLGWLRLEGHAP